MLQYTVPRYTGEFNQPLMLDLVSWVWLGNTCRGSTDDTEKTYF